MNNKLSNIFKGDKVIWMVFFFLCIISIVEVYSASSQLTYGTDSYLGPVSKHFSIMAVGFVLMLLTQNIKCRYFKIVTPFMLIISILTLIYVFIAGHATNGAQRWIPLFGFQFQPSELAKGTMILATAQILSAMQTENGADRQAFKYIITAADYVLKHLGIKARTDWNGSYTDGNPIWGKATISNKLISLNQQKQPARDEIPDVIGMGARDAVFRIESLGVRVRLQGRGKVTKQSLEPGHKIKKGEVCMLLLE